MRQECTPHINDAHEFFAPVQVGSEWQYIYPGGLDEYPWFDPLMHRGRE